jgi:hypothetical protein
MNYRRLFRDGLLYVALIALVGSLALNVEGWLMISSSFLPALIAAALWGGAGLLISATFVGAILWLSAAVIYAKLMS